MCQWITEQKKLLLLAVFTTHVQVLHQENNSHIRAPPHYGAAILRSNNLAIAPNIYEIITHAGRNATQWMVGINTQSVSIIDINTTHFDGYFHALNKMKIS